MFELPRQTVPGTGRWASWFPAGSPGLGALPDHVRSTGTGSWWADRPVEPRAGAVSCAGYVVMGGDPRAVAPEALAQLAHSYFAVPDRFLPLLGASFERIVPWERMIWVQDAPGCDPRLSADVLVRRLTFRDASAVRELGPEPAWITESWGGPHGLAGSGHCWGAFRGGRLLSVACTYFLGDRYEDVAVVTVPDERGKGLAAACVRGLCADVAARGRTPSWTCSRYNEPSRRLAVKAGFRLVRAYVHYAVGAPATLAGDTAEPLHVVGGRRGSARVPG